MKSTPEILFSFETLLLLTVSVYLRLLSPPSSVCLCNSTEVSPLPSATSQISPRAPATPQTRLWPQGAGLELPLSAHSSLCDITSFDRSERAFKDRNGHPFFSPLRSFSSFKECLSTHPLRPFVFSSNVHPSRGKGKLTLLASQLIYSLVVGV